MEKIPSFDDCAIAVTIGGNPVGPPILFSHHLGGAKSIWVSQISALEKNFRTICYDTRGHGASHAPAGPYNVEMLGRDALAVMAALDIGRAHFVGLSQGGMTGMWLAAHHPEKISRLALANTTPFIPNKVIWDELAATALAQGMDAIAAPTVMNWLSDAFKNRAPERAQSLVDVMRAMPPAGYAANCAVLRDVDLRGVLAGISAPTLVIGGAEDGPRGAAAPQMASTIPHAQLKMIADAAHLSACENPDAFNKSLLEFFA